MYFFLTVILFIKRTCVCCCTTRNWTHSHFNEWINSCLTQLAKQMESTFTACDVRHRANRYAENAWWIYDSNFHYIYAVFTYYEYRHAGVTSPPICTVLTLLLRRIPVFYSLILHTSWLLWMDLLIHRQHSSFYYYARYQGGTSG